MAQVDMPIAYLYGSFWYDPRCAERLFVGREGDLDPCYEGETMACYDYVCDHCGATIKPRESVGADR